MATIEQSKLKTRLIGKKFGKLTVIEFADWHVKSEGFPVKRQSKWKCLCECGNYRIVFGFSLLSVRGPKSCGCLRKIRKSDVDSAFNVLYNEYKYSAIYRNYCFELTKEEFKVITSNNCYYCTREPLNIRKPNSTINKELENYKFNGIDRVDNTKGYTTDNCVPCCEVCNRMKRTMEFEEFKAHITKIYNNLNK